MPNSELLVCAGEAVPVVAGAVFACWLFVRARMERAGASQSTPLNTDFTQARQVFVPVKDGTARRPMGATDNSRVRAKEVWEQVGRVAKAYGEEVEAQRDAGTIDAEIRFND
jgi:hypothetical protein